MERFETQEALLVWLINFFGSRFGGQALLKGGMVLRLLDCPRLTNDVDFVFVPYSSKKDVEGVVLAELAKIQELNFSHQMHSKILRIHIEFGGQSALVEVNVAAECLSQPMSTGDLSHLHGQSGKIIRIMDLSVGFAHKCAAWNERRLIRDLFDMWFLYRRALVKPDLQMLTKRLSKIESKKKEVPKSMTIHDFGAILKQEVVNLDDQKLAQEMSGLLLPEDLHGLGMRMRSGLLDLVDELTGLNM